jgi:hypothetical protein
MRPETVSRPLYRGVQTERKELYPKLSAASGFDGWCRINLRMSDKPNTTRERSHPIFILILQREEVSLAREINKKCGGLLQHFLFLYLQAFAGRRWNIYRYILKSKTNGMNLDISQTHSRKLYRVDTLMENVELLCAAYDRSMILLRERGRDRLPLPKPSSRFRVKYFQDGSERIGLCGRSCCLCDRARHWMFCDVEFVGIIGRISCCCAKYSHLTLL